MNDLYNPKLKKNASSLRKEMTKEERHLWYDFLKTLPVTVNRQKIIGNYIADFYCAEYRIVIELDGSQHYEEKAAQRDRKRDTFFREKGITVLRYTNLDIKRNFKGVCQDILNHMRPSETAPGETPHPSPAATPSPQGEGMTGKGKGHQKQN